MNRTKVLREFSTDLQTLCNDGWSHNHLYVNVNNVMYRVTGIHKIGVDIPVEDVIFEIETESIAK